MTTDAIQPADQTAPPSTATMIMATSSRAGSTTDRSAAIAELATHDVVACTNEIGPS